MDQQPQRILVFGLTSNPGGIETFFYNLWKMSNPKLVVFDFVCLWPTMAYADEFKRSGSKIYMVPKKSEDPFGHIRALWHIFRAHPEYRVAYFNIMTAAESFSMIVPALLNRRIIAHSHNAGTDNLAQHRHFQPLLNHVVSTRLSCSPAASEFMYGQRYADAAHVIPNAIDLHTYTFHPEIRHSVRQSLGIPDDATVLINVGRLTRQKNPLRLVAIFHAFAMRHPESYLISVGDGDMRTEFTQAVQRSGLAEHIKILGTRHDIPQLLTAADCFVLPSLYEGLVIVGIESQAASLPIVSSDEIPHDFALTPLASFCSLASSDDAWVDAIDAALAQPRHDYSAQLRSAGYDVNVPSSQITTLLRFLQRQASGSAQHN